jgi:DNA polymerase-1
MLWKPIRLWLFDKHAAEIVDGLEGDDLVGLWATRYPGEDERVIVSEDKDLQTVPGLHLAPRQLHEGIYEVTPREAARFHLKQTLSGDQTDGYKGVPNIGEKRAEAILGDVDPESPEAWDKVRSAYSAKGLPEEVALMNARVARVLQFNDYNFETGEIKLWEPNR